MKINKKNLLITCLAPLFCLGCGQQWTQGDGSSSHSIEPNISKVKSSALIEFDQKLSQIDSQKNAQDAVSYFSNYVLENRKENHYTPKSDGISAQGNSPIFSEDIISQFAQIESTMRDSSIGEGIRAQSLQDSGNGITADKLTMVINEMSPTNNGENHTGQIQIQSSDIEHNQEIIRKKIPHLAATKSDTMTPLEASVVTYYMLTGDDGSSDTPRESLYANPSDLKKFTQKLIEKEDNNEL